MGPILFMCNANSPDVMPHVVAYAMNPNDVMCSSCDMHTLTSQAHPCNYCVPTITYWTGVQASQVTSTKIK